MPKMLNVFIFLTRFGRRLTYSVYMLLAGVFCLLTLAVPTGKGLIKYVSIHYIATSWIFIIYDFANMIGLYYQLSEQ